MSRKINLTRPLKPLNHYFPPLHDVIISPHGSLVGIYEDKKIEN